MSAAAYRCPVAGCDGAVSLAGSVFCESGEYSHERNEYAAEGDADVYRCAYGHTFAVNPPLAEDDEVADHGSAVIFRGFAP